MPARRPQLPRLSECRDCHEPIRFVKLPNGSTLPVNPALNPKGNVAARLIGGNLHGFVISRDRLPGPLDGLRFYPHHATCEAIDRTPKTAPAPADRPLF